MNCVCLESRNERMDLAPKCIIAEAGPMIHIRNPTFSMPSSLDTNENKELGVECHS
jgi:hypothetical protein